MNPSSHILTDIQRRLAEVRLLQLKVDAQSGALVFGLLLFVLLSAAGLGEMIFQLEKTGRTFLFVAGPDFKDILDRRLEVLAEMQNAMKGIEES